MGFGRPGNRTSHYQTSAISRDAGSRVGMVHDNRQVAHVWAQGSVSFGRSGNGNFYFHGPAIYSYGSHYVAGYILPAPGAADWQPGRVLINAISASVTTSGHLSDVADAARHRNPLHVPNLTELARLIENGISESASGRDDAGFATGINRRKLATYLAPRLAKFFSRLDNLPSGFWKNGETTSAADIVAAIMFSLGLDSPARRAAACVKAAERDADKARAAEQRAEKESNLRLLALEASRNPSDVAAKLAADAVDHAPSYRSDSRYGKPAEYAAASRRLFRAIRAGIAAGRTAQVRKAKEIRKVYLSAPAVFEAAALRHHRRAAWRRERLALLAAVAALRNPTAPDFTAELRTYRGNGGPVQNGPDYLSDVLEKGASAALSLQGFLGDPAASTNPGHGMAQHAARIARVDCAATAASLAKLRAELMAAAAVAARMGRYMAQRADVRAMRAALAVAEIAPADVTAEQLAILSAGVTIAERHKGRQPQSWQRDAATDSAGLLAPYESAPNGWRLGGWTPAVFYGVATRLQAHLNAARVAIRARAEADKIAAAAEAVRLWRSGQAVPRELGAMPRTAADGTAFVRATGVTRDESGAISGGVLETSQGAQVPLLHAVRVLRFLKACRAAGRGWQANGRTLPVGHYRVDSVGPDGSFRAGCHTFAWPEIERVAVELGLGDVAPGDTTEHKGV
jgi:hypothetical protein